MVEIFGLVLAAIGFGYFLWDRYRPPALSLDINDDNVWLGKIYWPNHKANDASVIVIYSLSILNKTDKAITLKSIELNWENQASFLTNAPISMLVQTGDDLFGKPQQKTVFASNDHAILGLQDWENFAVAAQQKGALSKGEVLQFSAVFFLPAGRSTTDFNGKGQFKITGFGFRPQKIPFVVPDHGPREGGELIIRREIPTTGNAGNPALELLSPADLLPPK